MVTVLLAAAVAVAAPPKDQTYMPVVPTKSFDEVYQADTAAKADVQARQQALLEKRYDLSNNPSSVQMSGQRKAVQKGVRVKLPSGASWDSLSNSTADQIKQQNAFPMDFLPLPYVKHMTVGIVFPKHQID